ncbi:nitrogen regulation protein NR(II) [Alteromonas sp. ASW11-36]|uniref:Sensory histidine kinase/phosphatase NtrB n=1 Tax=Alteromonas arenosi TaxID=3055817 RepID=A0ABT7T072_9ALTE|nr:nitrogen regulation protein NR(II) [Alteromonas sp. ASW11-36]MDM7861838.1 nitrogen regulation protein NR(II) [Alteromonas sp. ASW11-36]
MSAVKLEPSNLLDNLNTAVVIINADFNICYANFSAQRLFERSLNQILNSDLRDYFLNRSIQEERLLKALQTGEEFTENEIQLCFRDKRFVLADITVTGISIDEIEHLMFEVRRIDKQKRISQETLQHAQQHAARELIRGLAHEIKNPLGGIRGAAQLLGRSLATDEHREFTEMIIEQADRLRNLVDRLLGPNTLPRLRECNLHQCIERVRALVSADELLHVNVVRDYDPSIPDLIIDPDMIEQAVLNIVRNAQQALYEDHIENPTIELITRIERKMTIHGNRYPLCAVIKIIDNGKGIPTELRDTLFYPMVTSKSEGSGLGLSISQTLIDHHNGKIEFDSRPGKTEFSIYIPILSEQERMTANYAGK